MIKHLHDREVNASSRAIVDKINEIATYMNEFEVILRTYNAFSPGERDIINQRLNKLEVKFNV